MRTMRTLLIDDFPPEPGLTGSIGPYQEVPVALDEVRKLREIELGDLGPQLEANRPRLLPRPRRKLNDQSGSLRRGPKAPGHGPGGVGVAPQPVLFKQVLLEAQVVLSDAEGLQGVVFGPKRQELARWQCPEDEIDVFVGCLSHVVFRFLTNSVENVDP